MGENEDVVVNIVARLDQFEANIKSATDKVSNFNATTVAKGILTADAIKGIGRAALNLGIESLKAFGEAQDAVNKFELALKNQGFEVDEATRDFQKFATSIQKVTTFGDEAIINTGTMLTSFGLAGEQLKKTTVAALDLSKGLGVDLKAATLLLGKAAVGETSSLSRYGIIIDQNIPKADQFAVVLEKVSQRFGGAAQADLNNVNGKLKNFAERIGDIKEKIGAELLPVFDFWMDKIEKATSLIERMTGSGEAEARGRELTIKTLEEESDAIIQQANLRAAAHDGIVRLTLEEERQLNFRTRAIQSEKKLLDQEKQMDKQRVASVKDRNRSINGLNDKAQKEERSDLIRHTQDLLSKNKNYVEQMLLIRQTFNEQDTALLQAYLSDKELREITAHIKSLEDAGQFGLARQVQEAAVRNAQGLADEAELQERNERNESRARNFRDTMQFISTLASSENKKLAAIGKAAAIATATMDTFAAANKALTIPPPWVGIALAATVTAAGLANVARISGVKLARGGVVMPKDGGTPAVMGEAGKPEAVIPLDDERTEKMLARTLEAAGARNQGPQINIRIDGTFLEANPSKWQRLMREKVVPEIRRYTDISPKGNFIRRRGQS